MPHKITFVGGAHHPTALVATIAQEYVSPSLDIRWVGEWRTLGEDLVIHVMTDIEAFRLYKLGGCFLVYPDGRPFQVLIAPVLDVLSF